MTQAVIPARLGGEDVPAVRELNEVQTMLRERVIEWTKQWKQEGLEEGLQRGLQQGIQQGRREGLEGGRRALLRLVEKKFGALTAEQRERLEGMDLDELAERLIDASSLDELLGE